MKKSFERNKKVFPVRLRSLLFITAVLFFSSDFFLVTMSTCNLCQRFKERKEFKVLELYSGIGGTAAAIESKFLFVVVLDG